MKILKILIGIVLVAAIAFVGRLYLEGQKSISMEKPELVSEGNLLPCSNKPNCVGSMEDPSDQEHYLAPANSPYNPISKIQGIFEDSPRYSIVEVNETMIRAEFKSKIFRFVDDVIFIYDTDSQLLHFRSSSRVGYSDMGANRKRIDGILKQLGF